MTNYELLYIVSNQYTEDELSTIKSKVNDLIKKYDGQTGYEEYLGKKKLAYPIEKNLHGYYVAVEFELTNLEDVKKIENDLKLDKEILRSQIIKKNKTTAEQIAKRKKQKIATEQATEDSYEVRPKEIIKKETVKKEVSKKEVPATTKDPKIKIEDLDEKLDEILKEDNII